MSLSAYYLEYGNHLARLHRRRRRRRHRHRRVYAPTSNTASHDNHEKINSFCFPYEYGAPPELRYKHDSYGLEQKWNFCCLSLALFIAVKIFLFMVNSKRRFFNFCVGF